jgi:hypothetical protein
MKMGNMPTPGRYDPSAVFDPRDIATVGLAACWTELREICKALILLGINKTSERMNSNKNYAPGGKLQTLRFAFAAENQRFPA